MVVRTAQGCASITGECDTRLGTLPNPRVFG